MANKNKMCLTKEQYKNIINALKEGSSFFKPNERVSLCLILEANLGLRIGDILKLKMSDIVKDGDRYRLDIFEEKTSKKRTFTVPFQIYQFIQIYCMRNRIKENEVMFKMTERNVQKCLKKVADYFGYKNIGTHSFRKFFATRIYLDNDYNSALVQNLLQHSSLLNTQRYIGISQKDIEEALNRNVMLLE